MTTERPKATIKNKYAGLTLEINTYAPFDYKPYNEKNKFNKKQYFNPTLIRKGSSSTESVDDVELEDIDIDDIEEDVEEFEDEVE